MLDKELSILRSNPSTLTNYNEAISLLYTSGVLSFMRALGRVHILVGKETIETVALNGAYAAGFQDCLDILFNFREKVLDEKPSQVNMKADYGGLRAAVAQGNLTEEESNAIRLGSKLSVKSARQ